MQRFIVYIYENISMRFQKPVQPILFGSFIEPYGAVNFTTGFSNHMPLRINNLQWQMCFLWVLLYPPKETLKMYKMPFVLIAHYLGKKNKQGKLEHILEDNGFIF